MGLLKNFVDSVLFAVLFYVFLGIMIVVNGHSVPSIGFEGIGVITAIIYMFVMVANYRL